jgi:vitamin B12 transporter
MKFFYRFLFPFFLFSGIIFSQTDSVKATLNEVVITATKTETPYYSVGSSVSIITAEMIQKNQLKTVIDVLRLVPGLSVTQQGGPSKITYAYIRGTNSNHTLVVMDGVKMNDASSPSNAFDFSQLNTNDIDRIEVVNGPQSTLYGSDAIAGVINIITKKGNAKPVFSFLGETGANKYYRSNISALGTLGGLSYSVNASRSASDGISAANSIYGNSEKDGFSNTAFSVNLQYNLDPVMKVGFMYRFTKTKSDLDQNEKLGDDPNFTYRLEDQIWKLSFARTSFNGIWEQSLSASYVKRFNQNLDLTDAAHPSMSSDAFNNANRFKIDWQNNIRIIPNNLITLGIEREVESANTSYLSMSEWGPFESLFPDQSLRNTGAYIQDQFNYDNSFFTTVGVRYDDNSKFGKETTFRIAPCYLIKETNTRFKATYGTGFKAPSLFYLFDPAFGNPDLQPEKSEGWDFGIEQFFANNNFSLGITYFGIHLNDMFGFDANYKTINIDRAATNGVELTANASFASKISINGNYTFTETKNESEGSSEFGQTLLRRPKHQFSIISNYQVNDKLGMNVIIKYVGRKDDKDFGAYPAQRVTLPDYTLVDLGAHYNFFSNLTLTARLENLFDRQYEEVLFYGTTGRSLYVGLNLNLY